MKKVVRLSESDLNRIVRKVLNEQPDEKFDTPYNKKLLKQYSENDLRSLNIDDTIDVISGLIDGIPGIGNLISAGIDISHVISYIVRLYVSENESEKLEYGTLAFITILGSMVPVGGNSLNIMARDGIKRVLSKTPTEIRIILQRLGLEKKSSIFLSKSTWKYNLLLVLCKIFGQELLEYLTYVTKKLNQIYDKVKDNDILEKAVKSLILVINELIPDVKIALSVSKQI